MKKLILCGFLFYAQFFIFPHSTYAVLIDADGLLGQANYTSNATALTAQGFNVLSYNALDAENNRLFVNDQNNARTLVFQLSSNNEIVSTTASYVLGQANFTSNAQNTTQSGFKSGVHGVIYDSDNERLFVADSANRRVLVFNVDPATISNGMNASYVLGQADFTSSTAALTQSGLNTPRGMAYDSRLERIFVMDSNNSRIMIFDVDPDTIANGENALNVLGQADFTSSTAATTQSGFGATLRGSSYDSDHNRLFVSDGSNNHRILSVSMVRITTSSLPSVIYGAQYSQSISSIASHDTLSFSIVDGSLPQGISLNTTTGVISGVPTSVTTSTFTVQASDTSSTGSLIDKKTLTIEVSPPGNGPIVAQNAYQPSVTLLPVYIPPPTTPTTPPTNTNTQTQPETPTQSSDTLSSIRKEITPIIATLFTGPIYTNRTDTQNRILQFLLAGDPSIYPEGQITGYYGPLTKAAVKRFQLKYNITTVDNPFYGYAGPATREKIREVLGR